MFPLTDAQTRCIGANFYKDNILQFNYSSKHTIKVQAMLKYQ